MDKHTTALQLLQHLDPHKTGKHVENIISLDPALAEDLLSTIDVPLGIANDGSRQFLTCDYNRDMDSYRSPYTNTYFPPLDDGYVSSDRVRRLEEICNSSFDVYREMYYEGGLCSCYLWDDDSEDGFAGVVLLYKKEGNGEWHSIHVFSMELHNGKATYKITSTIILQLQSDLTIGGNLVRQTEKTMEYKEDEDHIANLGSIIEDVEGTMRGMLEVVYFGKGKDVVSMLRTEGSDSRAQMAEVVKGLESM